MLIPVVIILVILFDFFVSGGTTEGTAIISWYSYTYPLLIPIGVITLMMSNIRYISEKRPGYVYFAVSVLAFGGAVLYALASPGRETSAGYLQIYDLAIVTGTACIVGIQLLTMLKPLFGGFVIRSKFSAWTVFFVAVAVITISPLADIISPALGDFGRFFQKYFVPAADQGYYIVMNAAQLVFLARVILMQERLSPSKS